MSEVLIRAVAAPLEVTGDGRTVLGMVCPYGRVATVDDGFGVYRETIDHGAFARVMRMPASQVRVHLEHPGAWVGRGHEWRDGSDGLTMVLRLDDTESGREAGYKIRDGQTPGLSVGFIPGRTKTRMHPDGPVEHRETVKSLHHVALCPAGAYKEAQVHAVRSAQQVAPERLLTWQQWLELQNR